jgi:hypothetical protein
MGQKQSRPNTDDEIIRAPKPVMAERSKDNIEVLMADGTTYTTYIDKNENLNHLEKKLKEEIGYQNLVFLPPTSQQINQEETNPHQLALFYTQPIHLLPKNEDMYKITALVMTTEDIQLEKQKQQLTLHILIVRFQIRYLLPTIRKIQNQQSVKRKWLNGVYKYYKDNLNKLTQGDIVYENQYELLNKLKYIVEYAYDKELNDRLSVFLNKAKRRCDLYWSNFKKQRLLSLYTLKLDINLLTELEFYYYYDRNYAYRVPHTAIVIQKYLQLFLNGKISLYDIQTIGDTIPTILDDTFDRWKDIFSNTQYTLNEQLDNIEYNPNGLFENTEYFPDHPALDTTL